MRVRICVAGLACLALLFAACGSVGARTVPAGVAKVGKLRVTLDEGWRRAPANETPERHSAIRVYTKDGLEYDRLYLVGGIESGQGLFRDDAASGQPRFDVAMSSDDLAGLVAESLRAVRSQGAGSLTARNAREQGFTGIPGVRFELESTAPDEMACGAGGGFVIDQRFYAVLFVAEAPDYCVRHRETANRIIDSATLAVKTIGRF